MFRRRLAGWIAGPIRSIYSDALQGSVEPPPCRGCRHMIALKDAPGEGMCKRFRYKPVEEAREDEEMCGFFAKEFESKGRLSHYLVFAVPFSILLLGTAALETVLAQGSSTSELKKE